MEKSRCDFDGGAAGAAQRADGAVVKQHVLAELGPIDHAQHGKGDVGDEGHTLQLAQNVRPHGTDGAPVAMAQVDQQHGGHHQYAALKAAAGGQMAVQDDVENVDQGQGEDGIAAAALDDALDMDVIFLHRSSPPSSRSFC